MLARTAQWPITKNLFSVTSTANFCSIIVGPQVLFPVLGPVGESVSSPPLSVHQCVCSCLSLSFILLSRLLMWFMAELERLAPHCDARSPAFSPPLCKRHRSAPKHPSDALTAPLCDPSVAAVANTHTHTHTHTVYYRGMWWVFCGMCVSLCFGDAVRGAVAMRTQTVAQKMSPKTGFKRSRLGRVKLSMSDFFYSPPPRRLSCS